MEIPNAIIFNGIEYKLMGGKKRYYLSWSKNTKERKGAKGLHVAIWEFYSGKTVPKGFVIHHKDGNHFNNSYENLECLSFKEHFEEHRENIIKYRNSDKGKENLKKAIELSKKWHSSNEGNEWHSKHAYKSILKEQEKTCVKCESIFIGYTMSIYCSKKCHHKEYAERARIKRRKKKCLQSLS
jgi:hypothetical protein